VIITGDLADNYFVSDDGTTLCGQVEENFKIYQNITRDAFEKGISIIDMTGNHDSFAVPYFSSDQHYVLNYSVTLSLKNLSAIEDYWVTNTVIGDIEIISLCFEEFPTVRASMGYRITPSQYILDFVEARLQEPPLAKIRIVALHYSTFHLFNVSRSTSGQVLSEILVNNKVDFIINGHTHPETAIFCHHNGILEINGVDSKSHQKYAILTFDRGQMAYHELPIRDELFALLTYPIPKPQVSNKTKFDVGNTDIRVIVFSSSQTVNILASGDVSGKLQFNRLIRENLSLYTLPMNLSHGEYQVNFTGDWTYSVNFVVNDSVLLDT
jgi:hypothetical protein